jgi:hypothetical protein
LKGGVQLGAALIALVLMRWTHVSDGAFRVLSRMALTALDEPRDGKPADTYYGGRELLAMSLRQPFPLGDDEASARARDDIFRRVRRFTAELIKEGAIERVGIARDGRNQVYRLTLEPRRGGSRRPPSTGGSRQPSSGGLGQPPSNGSQGGRDSPPEEGSHSPPQEGWHSPQRRAATAPPRNHGGGVEELSQEETADLRTDVTVARAREPAEEPPIPPRPDPPGPGGFADPADARAYARAAVERAAASARTAPPRRTGAAPDPPTVEPSADAQPRAGPCPDDEVWVASPRRGAEAHRIASTGRTGCAHNTIGRGQVLTAEEAADFAIPCRICWPPPTTAEESA